MQDTTDDHRARCARAEQLATAWIDDAPGDVPSIVTDPDGASKLDLDKPTIAGVLFVHGLLASEAELGAGKRTAIGVRRETRLRETVAALRGLDDAAPVRPVPAVADLEAVGAGAADGRVVRVRFGLVPRLLAASVVVAVGLGVLVMLSQPTSPVSVVRTTEASEVFAAVRQQIAIESDRRYHIVLEHEQDDDTGSYQRVASGTLTAQAGEQFVADITMTIPLAPRHRGAEGRDGSTDDPVRELELRYRFGSDGVYQWYIPAGIGPAYLQRVPVDDLDDDERDSSAPEDGDDDTPAWDPGDVGIDADEPQLARVFDALAANGYELELLSEGPLGELDGADEAYARAEAGGLVDVPDAGATYTRLAALPGPDTPEELALALRQVELWIDDAGGSRLVQARLLLGPVATASGEDSPPRRLTYRDVGSPELAPDFYRLEHHKEPRRRTHDLDRDPRPRDRRQ